MTKLSWLWIYNAYYSDLATFTESEEAGKSSMWIQFDSYYVLDIQQGEVMCDQE